MDQGTPSGDMSDNPALRRAVQGRMLSLLRREEGTDDPMARLAAIRRAAAQRKEARAGRFGGVGGIIGGAIGALGGPMGAVMGYKAGSEVGKSLATGDYEGLLGAGASLYGMSEKGGK